MNNSLGTLRPQVRYRFYLQPGHGQSLKKAIKQAKRAGNQILEVDKQRKRVLVARATQSVWGCRFCLQEGNLVIADSEHELNAHAAEVHGWRP